VVVRREQETPRGNLKSSLTGKVLSLLLNDYEFESFQSHWRFT
jgi:hypothetical protein